MENKVALFRQSPPSLHTFNGKFTILNDFVLAIAIKHLTDIVQCVDYDHLRMLFRIMLQSKGAKFSD